MNRFLLALLLVSAAQCSDKKGPGKTNAAGDTEVCNCDYNGVLVTGMPQKKCFDSGGSCK